MLCAQILPCECRSYRKCDYERTSYCCAYKTLVDGPDSIDGMTSAIYCLSDSKKHLVASGAIHEYYGSLP